MKQLLITTFLFLVGLCSSLGQISVTQLSTDELDFVVADTSSGICLTGGYESFYKSTDHGLTWSQMSHGTTFLFDFHGGCIVNSNTYLVISSKWGLNGDATILRTTDGGSTWSNTYTGAGFISFVLNDIKVGSGTIIVAATGKTLRSTDGGTTWTTINLTSGVEYEDLTFNPINGDWYLFDSNDNLFISTDDGVTWNPASGNFSGSNNFQIEVHDDTTYITKYSPPFNQILKLDASNNILDTIDLAYNILGEKHFFNSDEYLIYAGEYKIGNQTNKTVFSLDTVGTNLTAQLQDFTVGSGYALCTYYDGKIARIDLTQLQNLKLNVKILLAENTVKCAGEDYYFVNDFTGYDSLHWYMEGNYISTADTLVISDVGFSQSMQPDLYGWYNGNVFIDSNYLIHSPWSPYLNEVEVKIFDTTPCYNETVKWQVILQNNYFDSLNYEIWYRDSLYSYLDGVNNYGTGIKFTPGITENDTIWMIRNLTIQCGFYSDTTYSVIYGQNDFSNNVNQSILEPQICSMDSATVQLHNVSAGFKYRLFIENDNNQINTQTADVEALTTNDTLTFRVHGFSPHEYYYDSLTNFTTYTYRIHTSDTMGCEMLTTNTFNFEVFSKDARIGNDGDAFVLGDTLQLYNFRQFPNGNEWSSSGGGLINTTDIEPKFITSSPNIYNIKHVNNPLPGCKDSAEFQVLYGSALPTDSLTVDFVKNTTPYQDILMFSRLDAAGDSYELYVREAFYNKVISTVLKRNQFGDTVWYKSTFDNLTPNGPNWMFIKDFEIGQDGYIYGTAAIRSSSFNNIDGINFPSTTASPSQQEQFIFKMDPSTGTYLYFNRIEYSEYLGLPTGPTTNIQYLTPVDLALADDYIYITTTNSSKKMILACDYNGNLINCGYINTGPNQANGFSYANGYMYLPSYSSPLIKVRSDNTVQIIVFSTGQVTDYSDPTNPIYYGEGSSSAAIYTMNYHPTTGLTNLSYLVKNAGYHKFTDFKLDNNDNIYLSAMLSNFTDVQVAPGVYSTDSITPNIEGTSILKYDQNYNLQWMVHTTELYDLTMDFAQESEELIISGVFSGSAGLYSTNEYYAVNEPLSIDGYIGNATAEEDYSNFFGLRNGYERIFLASISKDGEIISGNHFTTPVPSSINSLESYYPINLTSSPCGDVILALNRIAVDTITTSIKNQNYPFSNSILARFSNASGYCSTANLSPDTLSICSFNTDSVYIPISTVYAADSITYQVYQNNVKVDSATVNIQNKFGFSWHLNANTNTTDDLLLITTLPNVDTLVIQQFGIPTPPNFSYTDSLCHDLSQLISPNLDFDYTWEINGSTSLNDTLNFTPSIYTLDSNLISVHTIDNNGCYYDDTLHINVTPPGNPGILSDYTLYCDSSLIITYDTVGFSTSNITVNGNSTSNFFDENNLVYGTNPTYFYLTDTLGCSQTEYTHINNTFVPTTQFDSIYEVSCFDDLTIQYFGNFNSAQWIINGDYSSNPIPNEDLSNGLNDIEVYLSDQNGCESLYSFDILKNSFINAQIDSIYYLECDSTMSVPLDSNAYYSITWYMHTVPSNNYYWLANLSEGDNFGSLEVIDTNGCAMNYDFIVNYCYNLSTSNEDEQQFSVYPNPNNGSFYVDIPGELKSKNNILRLYNDQGKLIYESQINENQNKISLSPAPAPGSYYITINLDNFEKSNKIIIH